jgi:hypothetical protein
MPKLVEFTSDEGTIYVNPTKVRIVHGPSKSNRNQSVIAFDKTHWQLVNLPVEQVREKLEEGM